MLLAVAGAARATRSGWQIPAPAPSARNPIGNRFPFPGNAIEQLEEHEMQARRRGMTLDTALISVNLILVTVLFAMLIWRRVYRALPVFVTYVAYTVLLALASLACTASTPDYLLVWSVGITIDTLFYLCVLVELGSGRPPLQPRLSTALGPRIVAVSGCKRAHRPADTMARHCPARDYLAARPPRHAGDRNS